MDSLQVHSNSASSATPDEAALLAAYRGADDGARSAIVRMVQSIASGSPRQRPALALVPAKPRPRAVGAGTPETLLVVAAIAIFVLIMATWPSTAPAPAPTAPVPLPGTSIAYAPFVFIDEATGCQYLSTHNSAGLAPRIAADGKTHLGCKGGSR